MLMSMGVHQMLMAAYEGGGGQIWQNLAYVVYGWPQIENHFEISRLDFNPEI